jgi:UDP-N-acetylmuramate--alanine ligase
MNLNNLNSIYLLGIGGIGMSALARYFNALGVEVSGYDKTSTMLTDKLQDEGISVHFEDDVRLIPENIDLVIYTPAIPAILREFLYLKESGIPIKKRAEVLGMITRDKKTIAVSGTHGKTTVSSMIAHLLYQSEVGCSAFLGGIAKNYDSNLLVSPKAEIVVVEADEFDRSFMQLQPYATVITSVDADHLDIYGNFEQLNISFSEFAAKTADNGILLVKKGVSLNFEKIKTAKIFTYSITEKADFGAENIRYKEGAYSFDLITPQAIINNVYMDMHGYINVENAVAACAIALIFGVSVNELKSNLASFAGVKRRFDYQIRKSGLVFIDDYAHHPEEIRGFVNSVKEMYPGKKVLGIFQPHLYSRTRDFADEFAKSLGLLDEVILLPVYPARELPIEGVDSEMLLNKIQISSKRISEKEDLMDMISNRKFDVLLTIGAGDIDKLVEPVKNHLLFNYLTPEQ